MRGKTILILVLMLPMLLIFPVGALASDDQYRQAAVDWMREHHSELVGFDDVSWVFNMSEPQMQGKWEDRSIDLNGTCKENVLEWRGRGRHKGSWTMVSVNENSYTFNLTEDPPPEESDPTPPPEEPDPTPPPEEPRPKRRGTHIEFEDELSWGYIWRDQHVLLAVKLPGGPTHVKVMILSTHGVYSRTVLTQSESFCIYFKSYWFEGDYILVVTTDRGTYSPEYTLARSR
jgi:hypothetical protein